MKPAPFNDLELAQLQRLVFEAFALRESGYVVDAIEAVETWYLNGLPDRLERAARTDGAAR